MIYSLPPLITGILLLNVIFFLINMESEERWRLLPLCFATMWWQFGDMFIFNSVSEEVALAVNKIVLIGILYIPVGMLWMFRPYFHSKHVLTKHQHMGHFLDGIDAEVDLGYQGIAKFCPKANIIIPAKKPKNRELSASQRKVNTKKARSRVLIENAIGGVKRMRIVSEKCRLRCNKARDQVMRVAAGLWNHFIAIEA